MSTGSDYYTVLGVESSASADEIKTAFKKLALRYHPDVYRGEDAHERMRLILQAYQTLNDPAARKQYDSRRGGSGTSVSSAQAESSAERWASQAAAHYDTARRSRKEASAWARRDRQRYYDFPEFFPGRPVRIDLIEIAYTLTPQQVRELVRHGLLRGIAPEAEGGQAYFCHRCHHHWQKSAGKAQGVPSHCPECQAADWSEYLLMRCMHCNAVFESEQIRYTIGSLTYGRGKTGEDLCPPYELFPLCPYCGKAHWSQAEEERVGELREQAAQRATVTRLLLFGVLLVTVAIIGALILTQ